MHFDVMWSAQLHKATQTAVVCVPCGKTLSIQRLFHWHLTSLCLRRQRPGNWHMGTFCTECVHTESLIQWNKWGEICSQGSWSTLTVCSSDFICLMCLGPLGLCSLVMRRTGQCWASCWHKLVLEVLVFRLASYKANNLCCRVRLAWKWLLKKTVKGRNCETSTEKHRKGTGICLLVKDKKVIKHYL